MNHKEEPKTTVVHCMRDEYDVYIGRANPRNGLAESKWANPFHIGKDGTREEVLETYKEWVPKQSELLKDLHELRGRRIGCWCKPREGFKGRLLCHGQILAELADTQEI